jgi:hypothetical protein
MVGSDKQEETWHLADFEEHKSRYQVYEAWKQKFKKKNRGAIFNCCVVILKRGY